MTNDSDLLRQYIDEHSDAAFRALVDRHVNLVYTCALGSLQGDVHRARDVTQSVFIDLARKASFLRQRQTVAGWLYISAHHAAAQLMRSEQRRQKREAEAHDFMQATSADEVDDLALSWDKASPAIHAVITQLSDTDRDAVVLRFFERRSFQEIGTALALSEDAAQKRVARAIDKLRALLVRHGITSTSAAIVLLLDGQAIVAAPSGFAATIVSAAAMAPPGAATVTFALMTTNTLKVAVAAAVLAGGTGALVMQWKSNTQLRSELADLRHRQLESRAEIRSTMTEGPAAGDGGSTALHVEVLELQAKLEAPNRQLSLMDRSNTPIAEFTLAKGLKPVGNLVNAGKGTASAAFETRTWAHLGGATEVIGDTMILLPETQRLAEELFRQVPASARNLYHSPEQLVAAIFAGIGGPKTVGIQVLSEREGVHVAGMPPGLANDASFRTLRVQGQDAEGNVRENELVFQETPDGWRQVVFPNTIVKAGRALLMTLQTPSPPASRD